MKFSNINPENKTPVEIREEAYKVGFNAGYEQGQLDACSEGELRAAYEQGREDLKEELEQMAFEDDHGNKVVLLDEITKENRE